MPAAGCRRCCQPDFQAHAFSPERRPAAAITASLPPMPLSYACCRRAAAAIVFAPGVFATPLVRRCRRLSMPAPDAFLFSPQPPRVKRLMPFARRFIAATLQ